MGTRFNPQIDGEPLVPLQKGSVAMIIHSHAAGKPVLLIDKYPGEEVWKVVTRYGGKLAVPSSHLMMLEGFNDSRLHDRLVIKHYSSKKITLNSALLYGRLSS